MTTVLGSGTRLLQAKDADGEGVLLCYGAWTHCRRDLCRPGAIFDVDFRSRIAIDARTRRYAWWDSTRASLGERFLTGDAIEAASSRKQRCCFSPGCVFVRFADSYMTAAASGLHLDLEVQRDANRQRREAE